MEPLVTSYKAIDYSGLQTIDFNYEVIDMVSTYLSVREEVFNLAEVLDFDYEILEDGITYKEFLSVQQSELAALQNEQDQLLSELESINNELSKACTSLVTGTCPLLGV